MKKVLLVIFLFPYFFLILSSCKKKTDEVPADILKQKEMISILTDVQVAEAALTQHAMNGTPATNYTGSYYKFVFQKHHITAEQYSKSMDWYTRHPDRLNKIYEEVINELSKKQSEVTNK